ncbi:MAG TPA: hypothetical protein VLF89_00795 [Candidatus Saccharimonadales bacterium]|nr:hypothetical protein [Candidatus Saccharimonadales bacterium]
MAATGERLEFKYDPERIDPDFPSAGSLSVTIQTDKSGILRIASWQETPVNQAGGLVDNSYPYDGNKVIRYPVTGENKGEHDRVAIGFKPEQPIVTADETKPIEARYYEVVRTDEGKIQIKYIKNDVLEATIPLRNGQPTPTPTLHK